MGTLIERIGILFQNSGAKSRSEFASKLGVDNKSVSNYLDKGTIPRGDVLCNMLSAYPEFSPEWLMLGTGSMYREEKSMTIIQNKGGHHNATGTGIRVEDSSMVENLIEANKKLAETNNKLTEKLIALI